MAAAAVVARPWEGREENEESLLLGVVVLLLRVGVVSFIAPAAAVEDGSTRQILASVSR